MNQWNPHLFYHGSDVYALPASVPLSDEVAETHTLESAPPLGVKLAGGASTAVKMLAVMVALGLDASVPLTVAGNIVVVNARSSGLEGQGPEDLKRIGTSLRERMLQGIPANSRYILESPATHGASVFESLVAHCQITPTDEEREFITALLTNQTRYTQAWAGEVPEEWRRPSNRNDGCYKILTEAEVIAVLAAGAEARVSDALDELGDNAALVDPEGMLAKAQEEIARSPAGTLSPAWGEVLKVTADNVDYTLCRV